MVLPNQNQILPNQNQENSGVTPPNPLKQYRRLVAKIRDVEKELREMDHRLKFQERKALVADTRDAITDILGTFCEYAPKEAVVLTEKELEGTGLKKLEVSFDENDYDMRLVISGTATSGETCEIAFPNRIYFDSTIENLFLNENKDIFYLTNVIKTIRTASEHAEELKDKALRTAVKELETSLKYLEENKSLIATRYEECFGTLDERTSNSNKENTDEEEKDDLGR